MDRKKALLLLMKKFSRNKEKSFKKKRNAVLVYYCKTRSLRKRMLLQSSLNVVLGSLRAPRSQWTFFREEFWFEIMWLNSVPPLYVANATICRKRHYMSQNPPLYVAIATICRKTRHYMSQSE